MRLQKTPNGDKRKEKNMKKQEVKITRFDLENGFEVEVEVRGEEVHFHMCHYKYGGKLYMFGTLLKYCPENKWEEFISENANIYIRQYKEMFM
jgi:hypothetical protein